MSVDTAPNQPEPTVASAELKPTVHQTVRRIQKAVLSGLLGLALFASFAPSDAHAQRVEAPPPTSRPTPELSDQSTDGELTRAEIDFILTQTILPFNGVSKIPLGPETANHKGGACTVPGVPVHDDKWHTAEAIDFELPYGTPIVAIADGEVIFAEFDNVTDGRSSEGTVIIKHTVILPDGSTRQFISRYGHLQIESLAAVGTQVKQGEVIGTVDYMEKQKARVEAIQNGASHLTMPHAHLHFQVEQMIQGESGEITYVEFPIRYDPRIIWEGTNNPDQTCNEGQPYDGKAFGMSPNVAKIIRGSLLGRQIDQGAPNNSWDNTPHALRGSHPSFAGKPSLRPAEQPHRIPAR